MWSSVKLLAWWALLLCVELTVTQEEDANGLFPIIFNLASRASISANATCGETEPELFCKLVEHDKLFEAENRHCDICDARSDNPKLRHPIAYAIDGSQKWWQSPSLSNGVAYNYVTITLDLGQLYQVAYVIVKAANSPRPGNWILERSLDGQNFLPWQFFAMTDKECEDFYRMRATPGIPTFQRDDQVICTSRYSSITPLEDGEIFVSLVNGRPGAYQPSKILMDFTSTRYVRLRFQKIRTFYGDLMTFRSMDPDFVDVSMTRRYFYSIKDISVGGQCICYGHASHCKRHNTQHNKLQCECLHNTAGDNCERCLPLFNQKPWQIGGIVQLGCEECNCHGKARECVYNATVDALGLSLNTEGVYDGGGVCLNCTEYTMGINCERCLPGYYRPSGVTPSTRSPCRPCRCQETKTSTNQCVPDDRRVSQGLNPGDCICKQGYGGPTCSACAAGFFGYPDCQPCHCNAAGTVDPTTCSRTCVCKANVYGRQCDQCRPGFFNLDIDNPEGCSPCFCFGVSTSCESVLWGLDRIRSMDGWVLSNLKSGGLTLLPRFFGGWLEAKTYLLKMDHRSYSQEDIHYWLAPRAYLGNRLSSYGGNLEFTLKYTLDDQVTNRHHLSEPNIVLEGFNITITTDKEYLREVRDNVMKVRLHESRWFHLHDRRPITREEMMTVLYSLERLMIRATYHTAQDTVYIKDVLLDSATPLIMDGSSLPSVEKCRCPEGYAGLSCESCLPGWRRVNDRLYRGRCQRCECHGHSQECDAVTGKCLNCKDNTEGDHCERCSSRFYGDPRQGSSRDCQPCACPLPNGGNFFAERCKATANNLNQLTYECVNCQEGYAGSRCEMCAPGYYGDPSRPGGSCRRCYCGGTPGSHICHNVTGLCSVCQGNTIGERCDQCRSGYYQSAPNQDCQPCNCYQAGSNSLQCHPQNGQCSCRQRFTGQQCDRCQPGYGNRERGCERCSCNSQGSMGYDCNPVSGQCQCKPGIGGLSCDRCDNGYFGFSRDGCQRCSCIELGTVNNGDCDSRSGRCICRPGVTGAQCNKCQPGYYGLQSGQGCYPCACNGTGADGPSCNENTGQCRCLTGVVGRACDQCQLNFYGFSSNGCRPCEPCDRPGHICDPMTGRCVCPPNTEGPNCEVCITDGWGFDKNGGCKLCNCSRDGSLSQQCHAVTGACSCLKGFQGFSCDLCQDGNFDYPECSPCSCNQMGVVEDTCLVGDCECDGMGHCFCKKNVEGAKCDRCRPGTFSLSKDNLQGCTECYCFLRSQTCQQAPYVWLTTELESQSVILTKERDVANPLLKMFDYWVINDTNTYVPESLMEVPLYFQLTVLQLPQDMVLSYNGRLQFVHYFESSTINPNLLVEAPLVIIVGNGMQIHTGISSLEPMNPVPYDILLHEDTWHLPGQNQPVSRQVMMIVLQKVEAVLIRAVQDGRATYAEIGPVSIQKAVPQLPNVTSTELAVGVELCLCPERYAGESCQNPNRGYYRVVPPISDIDFSNPETIIGSVRPCQCYNHSRDCHSESGHCSSCEHNTTGNFCEKCADGFFGQPTRGTSNDCQPCSCPLSIPSNNFSPYCIGGRGGVICTACQEGYVGQRCESCAPGYYGNPQKIGDFCRPCRCNPTSSSSPVCDILTGQCPCLGGISGRTCDACTDPEFGVENGVCVSCYTGCTGILLDDLAALSIPLLKFNFSDAAYPWDQLYAKEKKAQELKDKLDAIKLTGMQSVIDMQREAQRYSDIADNLVNRSLFTCDSQLNTTGSRACTLKEATVDLLKNATELEKLVGETFLDIKKLVEGLDELVERLLYNQTGINMTAALEQAERILKDIMSRNFTPADDATRRENKLAEELSEKIRNMIETNVNTSSVDSRLQDLRSRLQDLVNQTRDAGITADLALDKIRQLKDLLSKLTTIKDEIKQKHQESKDILHLAEDLLKRAEENLEITSITNEGLEAALKELNHRVSNLSQVLPGLKDLVEKAIKHALDLRDQAEKLDGLFADTRRLSEDAIKAAKAYKSIIDAISEAKKSAQEAVKAANTSTTIAKVEDLRDEVARLILKSEQQNADAMGLLAIAQGLSSNLSRIERELNESAVQHKKNRDDLDDLIRKMRLLPRDVQGRVGRVNRSNNDTMKTIEEVMAILRNLNRTDLQHKADTITNKTFNIDLRDEISRVRSVKDNITKLVNHEINVSQKTAATFHKIGQISLELERLKAKILNAQSRVNSMRMSLQADGQCYRSYRSPLKPSSANEVRFSFKLNNTVADMLIILLQQSPQEFISAEIRNTKVRLSWNSGKGIGSVTHEQPLKVDSWYQVLAKRVGSIGQLRVWSLEEGSELLTPERSASMGAGCSLMNLNANSSIFLAGSSDLYQIPADVTRQNFIGCLGDVSIDGNRLGVYNFKTDVPEHCSACKEVPQVNLGTGKVYVFNGRGFASFQVREYSSIRTKVELDFRTFWEDSHLFFVGSTVQGDYLSIELKGGRVAISFYMGGKSATQGITTNTYNNNQWTKVTFDRRRLDAVLKVGSESINLKAAGNNTGLDIGGAPMYFGGVPTELNLKSFRDLNMTDYFYGCMRNFHFGTLSPDDDTSVLVNVQTSSSCRENGINNVDFKGDGYLILQSEHLDFADEKNDISLTFATAKEDAILFIARDISAENYYSLSLIGGRLEAKFAAEGSQPRTLSSTKMFNDEKRHCASLIKDNGILQLVVDDEEQDRRNIPTIINFNKAGDLYLGGSPVAVDGLAATSRNMDGCISDVIVNGVLLSMSDAKQYKRADVGRCRYNINSFAPVVAPSAEEESVTSPLDPTTETPSADQPQSCHSERPLEYEADAKSVANSATFFADIFKVRPEDLAKNFNISFDFRTYYPDGLFGYLLNKDRSFYFGVQLNNRKLEVVYLYDEVPYKITFPATLNHGQWHSVFVEKSSEILSISYDKEAPKTDAIDEILDIELPLHLGGPQRAEDFTDFRIPLVTHSIRGCIRSLKVNGRSINITDTRVIQDVSGCFKNVEPGAYFDGESWGAYGSDFAMEPRFKMSMDFRTTSQSGVLLSATSRSGYGLTLELHEGKIKLGIKNPTGEFRAETTNENYFLYCDNHWHEVRASIFDGELSVLVDGDHKGILSMNKYPDLLVTDYPLFIGGFPEKIPQQASLSEELFIGCIRNLALNGVAVDWYSLPNMKGIRKSACPT